jgi:hypothetical protein
VRLTVDVCFWPVLLQKSPAARHAEADIVLLF